MEEIITTVTCDVCRSGIVYPICFQLNPCLHRACAKCFHELVPAGVFQRCPCPDCRQWVSSSTLLELQGTSRCRRAFADATATSKPRNENDDATRNPLQSTPRKKDTTNNNDDAGLLREVQEVPHFQPDEQMDPFRHWAIQNPNLYTGMIYVAYRCNHEEATFYKSNFKAYDSTVFMDDDSTDEMVKIFARILHPLLFQQSQRDNSSYGSSNQTTGGGDDSSSSSSPPPPRLLDPDPNTNFPAPQDARLGDCYRRQDRQHLALRCMYALSSGRVLTRAEQEQQFGGTTKNLKHPKASKASKSPQVLAKTQHLARELLKAYQLSCMDRKQDVTPSEESPSPIIHDLRPHRDDESERPRRKTPSAAFYEEPHWIPDDELTADRTQQSSSGGDNRIWAEELGLNEIYVPKENETNDGVTGEETPSSPIVPAILWILSAAFILSK